MTSAIVRDIGYVLGSLALAIVGALAILGAASLLSAPSIACVYFVDGTHQGRLCHD